MTLSAMVAVRQVTLATTWNVAGPKWEVPECKILSIQRLGTKKRNRKYLIDNLQVLSIGWNDNISDILDKVRYIAEINFTCFFFFFSNVAPCEVLITFLLDSAALRHLAGYFPFRCYSFAKFSWLVTSVYFFLLNFRIVLSG